MRKLFRFKYEPCNKNCYAFCSKLMTELRKIPNDRRESLVNTMVSAHNKLCDNPQYSFGLDVDENTNLFVSHFRTPEKTDLFCNTFEEAISEVCRVVMSTNIPPVLDDCVYGNNGVEDLGKQILKYCEDVHYQEILNSHCECKV